MKRGSLVECIHEDIANLMTRVSDGKPTDNKHHPKKGDINTAAFVGRVPGTPLHGIELVEYPKSLYRIQWFREVQPPGEVNVDEIVGDAVKVKQPEPVLST